MLNLIVIYQRCDVNMTRVNLRYKQFWGLVILWTRIDKESLEYQRCSVNFIIVYFAIWVILRTYHSVDENWQVKFGMSKVRTRWGVLKLFTVRDVILNITVICQMCDVNMTRVNLRYEQFWGLIILLTRIDNWSLECQRCSVTVSYTHLTLPTIYSV